MGAAGGDQLLQAHSHANALTDLGHGNKTALTPEAIGDYVAGPNHVLPTGRRARFSSGLSLYDFLKRTSLVKCGPDSFARLGPPTVALARLLLASRAQHPRSLAAVPVSSRSLDT